MTTPRRIVLTMLLAAALACVILAASARAAAPPDSLGPIVAAMLHDLDKVDGTPARIQAWRNNGSQESEQDSQAEYQVTKLQGEAQAAVQQFAALQARLETDPRILADVHRLGGECGGLAVLYLGHSTVPDEQGDTQAMFLVAHSATGAPRADARLWVRADGHGQASGPWPVSLTALKPGVFAGERAQVVLVKSGGRRMPGASQIRPAECAPDTTGRARP